MTNVFSQVKLNQTNKEGKKVGYWEKKDDLGYLVYRGFFVDGHPVDSFYRYYEGEDLLKSITVFDNSGLNGEVFFFWKNDSLAAKGFYKNKQKHGAWEFYSYYTKKVVRRTPFKNGKKDGREFIFYEDSTVCEIIDYDMGVKDGEWQQFFPNGVKKKMANYTNGVLSGEHIIYYTNGMKRSEGVYVNGLKEGVWKYYGEDGLLKSEVVWEGGVPENWEEVMKYQEEQLELMEENAGKIEEPSIDNIFE
jgi:antitoxin component YwqK of YwqJK toxin-antitoxin module